MKHFTTVNFKKTVSRNCRNIFLTLALFVSLLPSATYAAPGNRSIPVGSYIINMGSSPATTNASLRPYGMVYDLINNYNVPIVWSIDPTKTKDGRDFQYLGSNYSGGTFIVEGTFINATVGARITYWETQGIIGRYTTGNLIVPEFTVLNNFPVTMIDNVSSRESIMIQYFTNAMISSAGYTTGTPSQISNCTDIFVIPHADPTYAAYGPLRNFLTVQKGYVFAQCHSVSRLESLSNTAAPNDSLNFLSAQGLQCYQSGRCLPNISEFHATSPAGPYTENFPTEAVMQYMGNLYNAYIGNGTERWFIPTSTSQWRGTSKRLLSTSNGTTPKEGTLAVTGPAYGNAANGQVMYASGHSWNGTSGHFVNAQRVFFNYILAAGKARELAITATYPATMTQGTSAPLTSIVSSGIPPYTYQWVSNNGGGFSTPTASATNFTAPSVTANTDINIKLVVTDACGRKTIYNNMITILFTSPLPVSLTSFTAVNRVKSVDLAWSTASEKNNDYFSIERSSNGGEYTEIGRVIGSGNSTSSKFYKFSDPSPLAPIGYYRLKQMDFDGEFEYSKIVTVKRYGKDQLTVYPNPASPGEMQLQLPLQTGDYEIRITSVTGTNQLLHKGVMTSIEENVIALDPESALKPGVYILRLITTDQDQVMKIVIQQ